MKVKSARVVFGLVCIIHSMTIGCGIANLISGDTVDYRQEMRELVTRLGDYAKALNSDFIIIPQNGQELITDSGEPGGVPQTAYLQAIDATGRESMFYGYYSDDEETPKEENEHLLGLCLLCEQQGVEVLAVDYCSTRGKMDASYQVNEQNGFISFAADERNLTSIPEYPVMPHNVNSNDVGHVSQAKNLLYLINSEEFNTKQDFIDAVSATNYDLIIMDLYHNEEAFTQSEITWLKTKQNGGRRLVVCYLSIGEAESYRYYWQNKWNIIKPGWMGSENPDWAGNYIVRYWDASWQDIIFGNDSSYVKKILDAGFDGVYLDIIDAFEYYEEKRAATFARAPR